MKRAMTIGASPCAGLICIFSLVAGPALGQTSPPPATSEPRAERSGTEVALPRLPWTLPTGKIEIRGALGLLLDPGQVQANLAASVPLTDWFQVTLTHQLQPSATVRVGKRGARLQASFTAGITALDLLGETRGWFGNASVGFEAWSATWLIGSVTHEVEHRPHFGERTFSDFRLGLVLTPHPRLRLQYGLVTRTSGAFLAVGLGSALHPGGRGWPLIQWQLLPSLSLDGYGSVFLYEGRPYGIQGQVGFTWTSP